MAQDVLLFTRNMSKAVTEIEAAGGRVSHQFTDKVLVAHLPDDVDAGALKQSKTSPPRSLDSASQLAAAAWEAKLRKSRSRAVPRGRGLPWDTPGFEPPDPPQEKTRETLKRGAKKKALSRSTGTPTSLSMEGSIAVGVVMVSGTQAGLVLSAAEQTKVMQEVQEGLNFLATIEPLANISFVYDIKPVTVTVLPGPAHEIAGNWSGFPAGFSSKVDAGVVWPNGKAYFFKGSQYIAFDMAADKVSFGYPLPISGNWPGFPGNFSADGIDAALTWPNGKAYFFKGSKYVRYDIASDKVDSGPHDIAGNWVGFPASFAAGVDAAVLWNNGKAYFFKGDQYLRYDVATDKVDVTARAILNNWPGLMKWKH